MSTTQPILIEVGAKTACAIADDIAQLINDYQTATGRHHVPGYRAWNTLQTTLVEAGCRDIYDGNLPGGREKEE